MMPSAGKALSVAVATVLFGMIGGSSPAAQIIAPELQQVAGQINAIEAERGPMKIYVSAMQQPSEPSAPEEPTVFLVSRNTMISKGVRQVEPGDLNIGDWVKIDYVPHAGENIAQAISVKTSSAVMRSAAWNEALPRKVDVIDVDL